MERRSAVERHARVHCRHCGGFTEPSKAAQKDLVRGMDRNRKDWERIHAEAGKANERHH